MYSNVTAEEMQKIIQSLKLGGDVQSQVPDRIIKGEPLVCKYAEDMGVKAFANLPCRGNKIKCLKMDGYFSYEKACNPGNCKFFEAVQ